MISVAEARSRILQALEPMPAEQVGLSDGLGRVLARDVAARRTQPPLAVSAMDGYAVRAADVAALPARLAAIAVVEDAGEGEGAMRGRLDRELGRHSVPAAPPAALRQRRRSPGDHDEDQRRCQPAAHVASPR